MREIRFRGRDICTGEWIYGDLRQRAGCLPSIIHSFCNNGKLDYCETPIHRDSLGQFTGLYDKNDNEIYEGDILVNENQPNKCIIEWNRLLAQFQGTWSNIPICAADIHSMVLLDYKVIGNIHDNPISKVDKNRNENGD